MATIEERAMATIEERAMATIEERATQDANERVGTTTDKFGHWLSHRHAYIRVATEQDQISRADERERCIRAAIKWNCDKCHLNAPEWRVWGCSNCEEKEQIRKAMEGGEG